MNEPGNQKLAKGLIDGAYVDQGAQALRTQANLLKVLLSQRRLPDVGWAEQTIEYVLAELALMDSNNFTGNVGVGEREARIISPLVSRRHYHMCHGIGRSGDVAAVQPKAAGSSLLNQLTNCLALDAIKQAGLSRASSCVVLPLATGMSVALTLLTLRKTRPAARYVLWSRIDQKSCLKAVETAALEAVAVPLRREGDELVTDTEAMAALLAEKGAENVLCVLSCTSCFAPRVPDRVEAIAELCAAQGVPHVINNAYGVGCSKTMHAINEAMRVGRVDAVVQSTDKNFLVPIGGAVVCGGPGKHGANKKFVAACAQIYPGRASSAPIVDMFITLLGLGAAGWKALLKRRKDMLPRFRAELEAVAAAHGERIMSTPRNNISMAMSLANQGGADGVVGGPLPLTFLGSMLFSRAVSGTRIVERGGTKTIAGVDFVGFGSHCDDYGCAYVTAACALGMEPEELTVFCARLSKCMLEFRKQVQAKNKEAETAAAAASAADPPPPPAMQEEAKEAPAAV